MRPVFSSFYVGRCTRGVWTWRRQPKLNPILENKMAFAPCPSALYVLRCVFLHPRSVAKCGSVEHRVNLYYYNQVVEGIRIWTSVGARQKDYSTRPQPLVAYRYRTNLPDPSPSDRIFNVHVVCSRRTFANSVCHDAGIASAPTLSTSISPTLRRSTLSGGRKLLWVPTSSPKLRVAAAAVLKRRARRTSSYSSYPPATPRSSCSERGMRNNGPWSLASRVRCTWSPCAQAVASAARPLHKWILRDTSPAVSCRYNIANCTPVSGCKAATSSHFLPLRSQPRSSSSHDHDHRRQNRTQPPVHSDRARNIVFKLRPEHILISPTPAMRGNRCTYGAENALLTHRRGQTPLKRRVFLPAPLGLRGDLQARQRPRLHALHNIQTIYQSYISFMLPGKGTRAPAAHGANYMLSVCGQRPALGSRENQERAHIRRGGHAGTACAGGRCDRLCAWVATSARMLGARWRRR